MPGLSPSPSAPAWVARGSRPRSRTRGPAPSSWRRTTKCCWETSCFPADRSGWYGPTLSEGQTGAIFQSRRPIPWSSMRRTMAPGQHVGHYGGAQGCAPHPSGCRGRGGNVVGMYGLSAADRACACYRSHSGVPRTRRSSRLSSAVARGAPAWLRSDRVLGAGETSPVHMAWSRPGDDLQLLSHAERSVAPETLSHVRFARSSSAPRPPQYTGSSRRASTCRSWRRWARPRPGARSSRTSLHPRGARPAQSALCSASTSRSSTMQAGHFRQAARGRFSSGAKA